MKSLYLPITLIVILLSTLTSSAHNVVLTCFTSSVHPVSPRSFALVFPTLAPPVPSHRRLQRHLYLSFPLCPPDGAQHVVGAVSAGPGRGAAAAACGCGTASGAGCQWRYQLGSAGAGAAGPGRGQRDAPALPGGAVPDQAHTERHVHRRVPGSGRGEWAGSRVQCSCVL